MTTSTYNHMNVILECYIRSPTEIPIQIKLPSNDWISNLESIFKRCPSKFKFLQHMNQSEWALSVNNIVIKRRDASKFGELLSKIAPVAMIQIVKVKNNPTTALNFTLKINYKSSMTWSPLNKKSWDDNYNDMVNKVKITFDINTNNFILRDKDGCNIMDGDDLNAICNSAGTVYQIIEIDLILNEHQKRLDINETTENIINSMKPDEIHSLQKMLHKDDHFDESKHQSLNNLCIDWTHVINCIKYEMYPKLSSVIKAMSESHDEKENIIGAVYDLTDECIHKVIDSLKNNRYLPSEECEYLKQLIIRARQFDPKIVYYPHLLNQHMYKDFDREHKALNKALLFDIFDVHQTFVFTNFNFRKYTNNEYQKDIKEALGEKFVSKYLQSVESGKKKNVVFDERFNLYPTRLINDNILSVFKYHFGVSLYVNRLKHNLHLENTVFEITSMVIPKSVSCIYDEEIQINVDSIKTIESYLLTKKNIVDFYKIRLTDAVNDTENIAMKIEDHYNINDIKTAEHRKLMIIFDRRSKYDSMYIFSYTDKTHFPELRTSYFVGFHFRIMPMKGKNVNRISTHFMYGPNIIRFFPEILSTIIPRIFKKPVNLSEPEYLDTIYDKEFKAGWCVTLTDDIFDFYYKHITSFDHISVNYNRNILYNEFHKDKPLLCFMDLLIHEMQSNNVNIDYIKNLNTFFNDNAYDTESFIDDILCVCNYKETDEDYELSNVGMYIMEAQRYSEFRITRAIVQKYNEPSQKKKQKHKQKICRVGNILTVDKCMQIQIIIKALQEFDQNKVTEINLSDLLGAYDHLISAHRFSNNIASETKEKTQDISFKSFEEIDHSKSMTEAQKYIICKLGGYCKASKCEILQKHIARRRERTTDESKGNEYIENDQTLLEILTATLNALHCYILHEKKELYRLKREQGTMHFITPDFDEDEMKSYVQQQNKPNDISTNSVPVLNFGVSVLKWLDPSKYPTFDEFREEITQNPESTINEKLYLIYSQECYIKMNNTKHEQYLLDELMSLKIYTDTDSFQSALRKAFWKSTKKEIKLSFYHWAMLLYKAALFHSKPIQRFKLKSKSPLALYHGLNKVFVLHSARPKYNGPLSTSLNEHVAHSFSGGTGMMWTIKPSYSNKFKLVTGIAVSWISQHKHEAEVLLINQYLPISATRNFEDDPKNNVDHLMYTIKSYQKQI
eukprot:218535_1